MRGTVAKINLESVSVEFPIFGFNGQSLRHKIMGVGNVGGHIKHGASTIMVHALNDISFELNEGDRVALIGANGAGKSTLLKVLAGVLEPLQGRATIEGDVVALFNIMLGMDQDATGYENIRLRGMYLGMSGKVIDKHIQDIADFSDLGEFLHMPIRTYSTGMHVRLAFAVSTAIVPEILLMDEMIGAGDAAFIDKANLRREKFLEATKIMVIATHSKEVVMKWCNKGILLHNGQIKAIASTEEAYERYMELTHPGSTGIQRKAHPLQEHKPSDLLAPDFDIDKELPSQLFATKEVRATVRLLFTYVADYRADIIFTFLEELYGPRHRCVHNTFPGTMNAPDSYLRFNVDLLTRAHPLHHAAYSTNFIISKEALGPLEHEPILVALLDDPIHRVCYEFLAYQDLVGKWQPSPDEKAIDMASDIITFCTELGRDNLCTRTFSRTEYYEPLEQQALLDAVECLKGYSLVGMGSDMKAMIDSLRNLEASDSSSTWTVYELAAAEKTALSRLAVASRGGPSNPDEVSAFDLSQSQIASRTAFLPPSHDLDERAQRLVTGLPVAVRQELEKINRFDMELLSMVGAIEQ